MGETREGKKRELCQKEKWLWLSIGLSTSLKSSFKDSEGTQGGGILSLLCHSPIIITEPY